ncbi:MAG: GNAT family N-acetyltransferase [Acidimicrobiia bacterium]
MTFVIRPARAEDVPSITTWTRDTFSWGDYVSDALPLWLEDEEALTMVCVYDDDIPVAVSRAQLLSPTEAWLSAARVHPDHRRSGMGMAMNDFGMTWARGHGARVARLAIEEGNEPARSQVLKAGYRMTGRWLFATAGVGSGQPLGPGQRLQAATAIDADAAWVFWSQSELAQAGRELIADGWRWRKATRGDLQRAVDDHDLHQSPGGWVITRKSEQVVFVPWVATTSTDAPLLVLGLRDLLRHDGEGIEMMIPELPWVVEALQREGFELRPVFIFSKAL